MWSKLYAHSHSYPDCMIIKRSIKSAGTSIHTINTWTLLCEPSVWHDLIRGPITARHFKVYFLAPRHAFLSFFTFHLTASDLSFLACHLTLPTFYDFWAVRERARVRWASLSQSAEEGEKKKKRVRLTPPSQHHKTASDWSVHVTHHRRNKTITEREGDLTGEAWKARVQKCPSEGYFSLLYSEYISEPEVFNFTWVKKLNLSHFDKRLCF